MSDAGGPRDVNNADLTFDSAAAASLPNSGQISSGTYRPTDYETGDSFGAPAPAGPYGSSLSVFNQTSPNGSWKLSVIDDFKNDLGSIAGGWELTITASGESGGTSTAAVRGELPRPAAASRQDPPGAASLPLISRPGGRV